MDIQEKLHTAEFYQKEGEYDIAIEKYLDLYGSLKKDSRYYNQYGCRILKGLCLCYRKKNNTSGALQAIDKAIRLAVKNSLRIENNDIARVNLATCYMNKGAVYDSVGSFDLAVENYQMGVNILRELTRQDDEHIHLLINALLNLATACYNMKCYDSSLQTFKELLNILGDNKENDYRGIYAEKYIKKIEEGEKE